MRSRGLANILRTTFRSTVLRCRRTWRASPLSSHHKCRSCRLAFAASKHRAGRVHAASNVPCGCESFKAAPESPGRVLDGEFLHALVSSPQHVFPTGELRPELAAQIDAGGLSVLREHAADAEFTLTAEQLRTRSQQKGA